MWLSSIATTYLNDFDVGEFCARTGMSRVYPCKLNIECSICKDTACVIVFCLLNCRVSEVRRFVNACVALGGVNPPTGAQVDLQHARYSG
jgi:hypothetical protein